MRQLKYNKTIVGQQHQRRGSSGNIWWRFATMSATVGATVGATVDLISSGPFVQIATNGLHIDECVWYI